MVDAQEISFSEPLYRFGTIVETDKAVEHDFYFVNTGKKPLKIKEVLTSCGCVASAYPSDFVLPGERAVVRLAYLPANRHEREVLGVAEVYTNAGMKTLEMVGTVLREEKTPEPEYRLRKTGRPERVAAPGRSGDFERILERMRGKMLERVDVAGNDAAVEEQVARLRRGGKWEDLDYGCYGRSNWEPIRHLDRVYRQAVSYVHPESAYCANDTLYATIEDALGYWLERQPKCHNWWYNQIAVPQRLGNILVLMDAGSRRLPDELREGLFGLMAWPDPRKWTGANKQDIALHHVQRGCLLNNDSIVRAAAGQLFYPVRFTNQEGLQVDYSYHQHGNQLYIGGYGTVFVGCVLKTAEWFEDTPYALQDEQLAIFSRFVRETYLNVFRGPYQDFSVTGRGISRVGAMLNGGMPDLLERMKRTDREHADEYERAKARFGGDAASGREDGSRFYWRSDYALHNRKKFDFSVRTSSVRTGKIECGNGENLRGALLSEGATCLRTTGDEYYDVFPVWNWNRVPGVTALETNADLQPAGWSYRGKAVFSGGVSNGRYSVMGYRMDDFGVEARKAWFMLDEEIVCLGAGIRGKQDGKVCTTVEQCNSKPERCRQEGNKVLKGDVLYYFPRSGGVVRREDTLRTGAWADINYNESLKKIEKPVFSLWIDHGERPENAAYAYVVAPGVRRMEDYDTARISIVRNDTLVQAVYQKEADVLQLVCYGKARFKGAGVTLDVDIPCVLMLQGVKSPNPSLYLADPMQDKRVAHIRLKTPRAKAEKVVELPQGDWKGSTIEIIK